MARALTQSYTEQTSGNVINTADYYGRDGLQTRLGLSVGYNRTHVRICMADTRKTALVTTAGQVINTVPVTLSKVEKALVVLKANRADSKLTVNYTIGGIVFNQAVTSTGSNATGYLFRFEIPLPADSVTLTYTEGAVSTEVPAGSCYAAVLVTERVVL